MIKIVVKEYPTLQKSMGTIEKIISIPGKGYRNIFFLVVFLLFTCSGSATNYYVSNTGDDSKTGTTPETAWQTIARVNKSKFAPGDSILFKRGGIWREKLIVSSSGAPGIPIVFGAYDSGNNPVIDGADIITGMTLAGGNIWQKTGITIQPNLMYLNGTVGIPQSSLLACDTLGQWYWDSGTKTLYVCSTTDPSGNVELGQRGNIVNVGAKQYITISNLTIQHSNESCKPGSISYTYSAVNLKSGGHLTVTGCTIQKNGYMGIYAHNSSYLTFDNNTISRTGESYSDGYNIYVYSSTVGVSNIIFTNNQCNYSREHGFLIRADSKANRITNVDIHGNNFENNLGTGLYITKLDSAVVYNNYCYQNGDLADAAEDYQIAITSCDNTDIYQNTLIDQLNNDAIQIYSDTLAVYGSAHNVRIFRNYISGVTNGYGVGIIQFHNLSINNLQVFYNTVISADKGGISLYHNQIGTPSSVNVFNNTFANNGKGIVGSTNVPVILRNNIFYNSTSGEMLMALCTTGLTHSNNLYYNTSGTKVAYGGEWYTTPYNILGFEPSAKVTDPLFTDAENGDFSLKAGSPAINNGVNVGLTSDILGNPIVGNPDIGAYEKQ